MEEVFYQLIGVGVTLDTYQEKSKNQNLVSGQALFLCILIFFFGFFLFVVAFFIGRRKKEKIIMFRNVLTAAAFSLAIPIIGYIVSNWILVDMNSG